MRTRLRGIRDWYLNLEGWKKWGVRVLIIALAIAPFLNWGRILGSGSKPVVSTPTHTPGLLTGNPVPNSTVASTQAEQQFTWHTVRPGDFIIKIAEHQGVPWESIVVANEAMLVANTKEYCDSKSKSYTHNPRRLGHFCNFMVYNDDGKPLVYANTLRPGDELPSLGLRMARSSPPTSDRSVLQRPLLTERRLA